MIDSALSDDDHALAAEFALGLLEGEELRSADRRHAADPAFARAVHDWREHLVTLDDGTGPVRPPSKMWRALEARLFSRPVPAVSAWRWLAGIGLAGAVAAALLLVAGPFGPDAAPWLTAEIRAEDTSLRLIATYDPGSGVLTVERLAGAAPTGRVLELWGIAGAAAPVSLGVLPDSGAAESALPEGLAAEGLTLAVSDEPPGGSPTGEPTGTVLAVGTLTSI